MVSYAALDGDGAADGNFLCGSIAGGGGEDGIMLTEQ